MGQPGHFGPAVIGEDQFKKEQEIVKSRSDKFGLAVRTNEGPVNIHADSPVAGVDVSLETLEQRLIANCALVDTFYQAEIARSEGVRMKALVLLDEAALHMQRDDLHDKLTALMEGAETATPEPPTEPEPEATVATGAVKFGFKGFKGKK